MKHLTHFPSLAEPFDLCPLKTAILELWRYLRLADHPNFQHLQGERGGSEFTDSIHISMVLV